MPTARSRAEVWGSPIAHSLSPVLHKAAYEQLNLPWAYERREVTQEQLRASLDACGPEIVGLSLTMPLKEKILTLVTPRSPVVELLHAANTVVRTADGWTLDNTDPWGVVGALGVLPRPVLSAWILGAGATARSVGYALSLQGTSSVTLLVRNLERAEQTLGVLAGLGLDVSARLYDDLAGATLPDLVVNTVPGSESFPLPGDMSVLTQKASLFDVVYSPWPSPAAAAWKDSPQPTVSGIHMLIFQAIRQVRLFVNGDGDQALPDEEKVLQAMRKAVLL